MDIYGKTKLRMPQFRTIPSLTAPTSRPTLRRLEPQTLQRRQDNLRHSDRRLDSMMNSMNSELKRCEILQKRRHIKWKILIIILTKYDESKALQSLSTEWPSSKIYPRKPQCPLSHGILCNSWCRSSQSQQSL